MNTPLSWAFTKLGSIASVQMGQSPDSRSYNESAVGLPFFQGKAEFGRRHPTVRKWCSEPTKIALPGDILLSIRAPVGPANVADVECAIGRGLAALRPLAGVDDTYLLYVLRHLEPVLASKATGTTFPAIGGEQVRSLVVPVAPQREQERIAEKLDTVLARVDACRDRLARVAPLLKRFRQSVLAAATSGRLTEGWRSSRVGGGWREVLLGQVLQGKPRNGYSPRSVDYPTETRSLTLSATTSGRFKSEHFKFIDEAIPANSHLWLSPGDVLIQRSNSLEFVGVSALFNGPSQRYIYPDLMMKVRADLRLLSSGYLLMALSSEHARNYFRDNATGTAGNMPKINQQTVINLPLRLPPLAEQSEIVRRVNTLFAFADRLESRVTKAATAVNRMTPSLLAKAFRGELVQQDPADESAADLLERLGTQCEAAPARLRRKRATG